MDYKVMIQRLGSRMILTQSEFAKELDVSITSEAKWETGKMN